MENEAIKEIQDEDEIEPQLVSDIGKVEMIFLCCDCGEKMVCTEFKSVVSRLSYKFVCKSSSCPKKPSFWWSWSSFRIVG